MSPLLKNIFVAGICLILVGFAFFFFVGGDEATNDLGSNADAQAALLAKTESFIERSQRLQNISIDTSFFSNSAFTSLRSFSTEVPNQPLGKNDIFSTAQKVSSVNTDSDQEAE